MAPDPCMCRLQCHQFAYLWHLLRACSSLEQLTVEVKCGCVQAWVANLVGLIRTVQRGDGQAQALSCVEVISASSVDLNTLWCVHELAVTSQ